MITDTSGENQLTQKEKELGWKLLFDGNTLTGWRTYKNKPGSWEVNNSMLCSERSASNLHADIITDDMFQDFELSIDWKISPKATAASCIS